VQNQKIIIVEGSSDKTRLNKVLAESVKIICTNGTISAFRLEELLAPYEASDLYVFVDADEDGEKTRALFKRDYPNAVHLYTEEVYREVETTPYKVLAAELQAAYFDIRTEFLNKG